MSKIFGIIILFAAAWIMYRLQAGGGCCGQQGKNSCGTGISESDPMSGKVEEAVKKSGCESQIPD